MRPETTDGHPRDFVGYGANPPDPRQPGDGRAAVRFAGRPGRAAPIGRFMNYAQSHDRVRICWRTGIARRRREHHKP